MKKFFTLYKIEQKLFFRNPDVFIFNLCMPVVVLILIGMIAGGKAAGASGMTYLDSSFVSLLTVGICCSALMSIPIVIVDYRNKKILKHFYCSPCSPTRLLAVDVICSAVMSVISAVILTLVAVIAFGYRMTGNIVGFVGTYLLTMISMFSIGLLVASVCRSIKSMNIMTSVLYFPMLLFSGATIPYELMPVGLRRAADVMPLGLGIRIMKAVSMGGSYGLIRNEMLILLALTIVCCCISVKFFRWE